MKKDFRLIRVKLFNNNPPLIKTSYFKDYQSLNNSYLKNLTSFDQCIKESKVNKKWVSI